MSETILNTTEAAVMDKRGFGERWLFSVRHVDNLLAQGLPHCKVGQRRVRIIVSEADEWMRQQFGTRRRAAVKVRKKKLEAV